MDTRIAAEIERGDEELARIQSDLAIVEQARTTTIDTLAELNARFGVVDASAFEELVDSELRRARTLNDDLAVVEISFDREMSLAERTTFYGRLLELARPGDVIAAVSNTELAFSLLWTDEQTAQNLARTAAEMAQYAVPEGTITYSVRTNAPDGTLTKAQTRVLPAPLVRSSHDGRRRSA
jgi:GGDEF domain-containing protein